MFLYCPYGTSTEERHIPKPSRHERQGRNQKLKRKQQQQEEEVCPRTVFSSHPLK